mgnify:CR=1 FL=1
MMSKPDHCRSCIGWQWGCSGYVPVSGSGENGVLLVAEAPGEHEAKEGVALVGKAGYYLFSQLQRAGIEREGFRIHNVLSCRPPDNKLTKMPYEAAAIEHCSPLLDETIRQHVEATIGRGKNPVILTLGRIAFKRIMGLDDKNPILRVDYQCYPFWSDKYNCWVIAADHPSYLMRGNNHLVPVLQFGFKRALEIAENGFKFHQPFYMKDPDPATFAQWVHDYENAWQADPDNTILAFDIETPHKQGADEEDVAKEEDDDYTILRCSFAYKGGEAASVPWRAEYKAYLEELFSSQGTKTVWNAGYDVPRITTQMPIHGDILDAMLMWHVLNSAMPKGLGFVTPFYCQDMSLWKHLSKDDPAGYNCQDSDALLRNCIGIKKDLISNKLWKVFDRHVVRLNKALTYMSEQGVLRDEQMRSEAETKLQDLLDVVEIKMEATVPKEARRERVYKKKPKDLAGILTRPVRVSVGVCNICGVSRPTKEHFRSLKKKVNACAEGSRVDREVEVEQYYKYLPFKVSKVGLTNYQKALRHQAILNRKEHKVTFDEAALMRLMKKYPSDKLYPLILEHRKLVKLISTYIGSTMPDGKIRGGMPVGVNGRIHTTFSHNPSTLRLASQQPNLQNLPRSGGENDLQSIIRNLIIASPGKIFLARDYSGIEAVLVGYFACDPSYIRLAQIDVHSYYTAYALNQLDGRVNSADLPQVSWPDEKLIPHLAAIKKEFKQDRNELYKHLVHGANFMQGAKGAQEKIFKETGIEFQLKKVSTVMGIYFELFPLIKRWHHDLLLQAEKEGFLRNPFGYIHRFNKVFSYKKEFGEWKKEPGDDANKVIAFLPQSTAAGIIKEAILRLYFNRFEEAGQYLRLQVHDELLSEVPETLVEVVDVVMKEEMEKPIPELALPRSYGMGEMLTILTEAKRGYRWGSMR